MRIAAIVILCLLEVAQVITIGILVWKLRILQWERDTDNFIWKDDVD